MIWSFSRVSSPSRSRICAAIHSSATVCGVHRPPHRQARIAAPIGTARSRISASSRLESDLVDAPPGRTDDREELKTRAKALDVEEVEEEHVRARLDVVDLDVQRGIGRTTSGSPSSSAPTSGCCSVTKSRSRCAVRDFRFERDSQSVPGARVRPPARLSTARSGRRWR